MRNGVEDGVVMHGSPDESLKGGHLLSGSINIGYHPILRPMSLHAPLGEQVMYPKGGRFQRLDLKSR
jgi:hypothetical protein